MRLVRLDDEQNPFETMSAYASGPNFVLNRYDAFEAMIREQGLIFWFRVWLTFCKTPCCTILKALEEQWPITSCWANVEIHNEFLTGSVEDAINYSLKAVSSLLVPEAKSPEQTVFAIEPSFKCLLQEYNDMIFGAVICSIFYKWLYAGDFDCKSQGYWKIPSQYLSLNYKPGFLEEFLVKEWKERLISLLGIGSNKIPRWIVRFLHQGPMNLNENVSGSAYFLYTKKITKFMKNQRDQIRIKIVTFDEMLLTRDPRNATKLLPVKQHESEQEVKQWYIKDGSPIRHICSYCKAVECIYTKFKMCPKCIECQSGDPLYYCSDVCQMEHWFQHHCNEHSMPI